MSGIIDMELVDGAFEPIKQTALTVTSSAKNLVTITAEDIGPTISTEINNFRGMGPWGYALAAGAAVVALGGTAYAAGQASAAKKTAPFDPTLDDLKEMGTKLKEAKWKKLDSMYNGHDAGGEYEVNLASVPYTKNPDVTFLYSAKHYISGDRKGQCEVVNNTVDVVNNPAGLGRIARYTYRGDGNITPEIPQRVSTPAAPHKSEASAHPTAPSQFYPFSDPRNMGGDVKFLEDIKAGLKVATDKDGKPYFDPKAPGGEDKEYTRAYQRLLNDHGANLPVTGNFGPMTREASQKWMAQVNGYSGPVNGGPINAELRAALRDAELNGGELDVAALKASPVAKPTTASLPPRQPVELVHAELGRTLDLPEVKINTLPETMPDPTPRLIVGRPNRGSLRNGENLATNVSDSFEAGDAKKHHVNKDSAFGTTTKTERWKDEYGETITVVERKGKGINVKDTSIVAKDGTTLTRHYDGGKEQWSVEKDGKGEIASNVERDAKGHLVEQFKDPEAKKMVQTEQKQTKYKDRSPKRLESKDMR